MILQLYIQQVSQPIWKEENLPLSKPIKLSVEIAPGRSRLRCLPRQNLLPSNASPSLGPILFCNPTLASAPVPTPVLAPVPAPTLASATTNNLFKQFIKTYLEINQGIKQPLAECKQFFKAKILEMYYDKSYMDCYHFCQQCKDHFETAGATGANRTPFATFFFRENISAV